LRAPVVATEGIWTATASENSDGGADVVAAASAAKGSAASWAKGSAASCGFCAAGAVIVSSSGGTESVNPFIPVLSARMSCH
jgi:hypothetical protein